MGKELNAVFLMKRGLVQRVPVAPLAPGVRTVCDSLKEFWLIGMLPARYVVAFAEQVLGGSMEANHFDFNASKALQAARFPFCGLIHFVLVIQRAIKVKTDLMAEAF